ncbi:Translocation-associated membrane protein 1 [Fasciolopsis buskii]|uniref:Translocation-associated membrane protein 1 n=1 Tax=Fasciolopsis buskii TaxID=27845 RepID=A0A8E0RUK8_9TREM|nr:Translocation-associated membrane protein 1 [Fasciolopsis buski]
MTVRPVRKKSKNPSYFSHEFIISNHGDIVSFFAMIIVMGLLYKVSLCSPYVIASQGTHSLSSTFLFIQHNVTDEDLLLAPRLSGIIFSKSETGKLDPSYGLGKQSVPVVDLNTGNFNTATIRTASMAFLFISQVFMVWNFITFHQRRRRDRPSHGASKNWFSFGQESNTPKKKEKKKVVKREEEEPSEGDSDQNNQKELRRRKPIRTRPQ